MSGSNNLPSRTPFSIWIQVSFCVLLAAACASSKKSTQVELTQEKRWGRNARVERFNSAQKAITQCMKLKGFTYSPKAVAADPSLKMDATRTDPTFYVRNLESLTSFGLSVSPEAATEFIQLNSQGAAQTEQPDFENSAALYGSDKEEGCIPAAEREVGPWSVAAAFQEFEAKNQSALKLLVSDASFQKLDAGFIQCMKSGPFSMQSVIQPAVFMMNVQAQEMRAAQKSATSPEDAAAAMSAASVGIDAEAFGEYQRCARPLSQELIEVFDRYL